MPETIVTSAFRQEFRALRLAAGAVLLVLPAVLILLAIMLVRDFHLENELRGDVRRADAQRHLVHHMFSLVQDAETGQRGYLLTSDPHYLKPYDDAVRELPSQLVALKAQRDTSVGDPVKLAALAEATQKKLAELRTTIELHEHDKAPEALVLVRSNRGKIYMDQIRILETQIADDNLSHVTVETAGADRALGSTITVGIGLAALLVVTLGGAGIIILRSFRQGRRMFAQLEEVATRQAAILESAVDAIITLNPSGTIESINPAGEQLFGYDSEALIRRDIRVLLDLDLPESGIFLSDLGLAESSKRRIEGVGMDQAGARFPVDIAFGPMKLASGTHVVAIIRDITERKRADEMKDNFISAVSHELRTPLTSITGSLGLLNGGAVPD
ncbi:MAG: CHASE3 domain-containing protein, partial [Caulobacteraceae bacterium]